jgi:hypothetical protein
MLQLSAGSFGKTIPLLGRLTWLVTAFVGVGEYDRLGLDGRRFGYGWVFMIVGLAALAVLMLLVQSPRTTSSALR